MKTPEEIKTGIRKCLGFGADCDDVCDPCPYWSEGQLCRGALCHDAIAYFEKLEKNASLNTMRDAELAKVPRWIKPKEELPKGGKSDMEFCEIVNIVLKNGDVTSGWMNGYEGFAYVIRGDNDYISRVPITDVEYWMPLPKHPRAKPEPPKVGGKQ